jgi:hypothetical protein
MQRMKKTSKTGKQKKSKKSSALAMCPIGSAGWCAYPFSVDQLEKRLKKPTEEPKSTKQLAEVHS